MLRLLYLIPRDLLVDLFTWLNRKLHFMCKCGYHSWEDDYLSKDIQCGYSIAGITHKVQIARQHCRRARCRELRRVSRTIIHNARTAERDVGRWMICPKSDWNYFRLYDSDYPTDE